MWGLNTIRHYVPSSFELRNIASCINWLRWVGRGRSSVYKCDSAQPIRYQVASLCYSLFVPFFSLHTLMQFKCRKRTFLPIINLIHDLNLQIHDPRYFFIWYFMLFSLNLNDFLIVFGFLGYCEISFLLLIVKELNARLDELCMWRLNSLSHSLAFILSLFLLPSPDRWWPICLYRIKLLHAIDQSFLFFIYPSSNKLITISELI